MFLHMKATFSLHTCSSAHFPFLESFLLLLIPIINLSIGRGGGGGGGCSGFIKSVLASVLLFFPISLLFVKLDSIRCLFKNILVYFHNLKANNTIKDY